MLLIFLQAAWRLKLSNKMRNTRRTKDKDIPLVLANKKRRQLLNEEKRLEPATNSAKNMPAFGVKNYSLDRPISEDDASIEAHKKALHVQWKKSQRDGRIIEKSMTATFADRRRFITTENPTVAAIKCMYPCLFDEYQVRIFV